MSEIASHPIPSLEVLVRRLTAEDSCTSAREVAEGLWLALYRQAPKIDTPGADGLKRPRFDEPPVVKDPRVTKKTGKDKPKISPLVTGEPFGELYLKGDQPQVSPKGENRTDLPGRLTPAPSAPALPGAGKIIGALRPLMRRVPSRTRQVLDINRTIHRFAEERVREVVMRPANDRWLDVAVVVDSGGSMRLWRQTVKELVRRLDRMGAFRSVRVWGWAGGLSQGDPVLLGRAFEPAAGQSPRKAKELLSLDGRRLIFLISDCACLSWRDGRAIALLREWRSNAHVVLVNPLPERLWSRTGLGRATLVSLKPTVPGPANAKLVPTPVRMSATMFRQREVGRGLTLPVVTLEPGLLAAWASLVAGRRRTAAGGTKSAYGFYWPASLPDQTSHLNSPVLASKGSPSPDAQSIVCRFRASSSNAAQKLATLLASAQTVNIPVMRLIRESMIPEATQVDEAEILLGGLLQVASGISTRTGKEDEESKRIEFKPGVRERLLDALTAAEMVEVLSRVSDYVADHWGEQNNFSAVLLDPGAHAGSVRASGGPFARVTAQILQRIGGPYSGLLERQPGSRRVRILHLGNAVPPHVSFRGNAGEFLSGLTDDIRRLADRDLAPDLIVLGFEGPAEETNVRFTALRAWALGQLLPATGGLSEQSLILIPAAGRDGASPGTRQGSIRKRDSSERPTDAFEANPSAEDYGSGFWAAPDASETPVRDLNVGVVYLWPSTKPHAPSFAAVAHTDIIIGVTPKALDDLPKPVAGDYLALLKHANSPLLLCGHGLFRATVTSSDDWKLLQLPAGDLSPPRGTPSYSLIEVDAQRRHIRVHRRFWRDSSWTDAPQRREWSIPSYWMDKAKLPTAAELARLPFWAVVALVGQCAERLAAGYRSSFPLEDLVLLSGIDRCSSILLDAAERCADPSSVIQNLTRQVDWGSDLGERLKDLSDATRAALALIAFVQAASGGPVISKLQWPPQTRGWTFTQREDTCEKAAAALSALAEKPGEDPAEGIFKEFRDFFDSLAASHAGEKWDDNRPVKTDRPLKPGVSVKQYDSEKTSEPQKWVMVAGTGRYELPSKVVDAAGRIGIELARAGYGMITCGWPGVDHVAARAFTETLERLKLPNERFLLNVLGGHRDADFPFGKAMRVSRVADESSRAVGVADAVILIGGLGGTKTIGVLALEAGKPVLPLSATGGDAESIAQRMTDAPGTIDLSSLALLRQDVPNAVPAAIEILGRLFGTPSLTVTPDRSHPPTEQDLLGLTRSECLMIAARCLRRVLPLARGLSNVKAAVKILNNLVIFAEQSALQGGAPTRLASLADEMTRVAASIAGAIGSRPNANATLQVAAEVLKVAEALMKATTSDRTDVNLFAANAISAAVRAMSIASGDNPGPEPTGAPTTRPTPSKPSKSATKMKKKTNAKKSNKKK